MPPAAVPVRADTDQLRQVLVNLLLNAAQAMNGIGQLGLSLEVDGAICRLHVDDNGPGIPAADRERVFEPFVSTKQHGEGTGLGLSICRRLIDAHGGQLTALEAPSGGARFCVVLPVQKPL
jgi:signal transduction histidine kinase